MLVTSRVLLTRQVPDYREIVKHPIDLLTMKLKCQCGEYTDAQQFADDLARTLDNCETISNQ